MPSFKNWRIVNTAQSARLRDSFAAGRRRHREPLHENQTPPALFSTHLNAKEMPLDIAVSEQQDPGKFTLTELQREQLAMAQTLDAKTSPRNISREIFELTPENLTSH